MFLPWKLRNCTLTGTAEGVRAFAQGLREAWLTPGIGTELMTQLHVEICMPASSVAAQWSKLRYGTHMQRTGTPSSMRQTSKSQMAWTITRSLSSLAAHLMKDVKEAYQVLQSPRMR